MWAEKEREGGKSRCDGGDETGAVFPSRPPSPPSPGVYVSPAKAKLKAFATRIRIQLKAPLCSHGGTAAETPCCLFPLVVVEDVAARLLS